jgi:hypothetical protein
MQPVYSDNFLAHLTLALDWMAVSLGLWGYPRIMNMNTHERLFSGIHAPSSLSPMDKEETRPG